MIWNEEFMRHRVAFDELVFRKEELYESSNLMKTHMDAVVEIIHIWISVSSWLCFDEEFI